MIHSITASKRIKINVSIEGNLYSLILCISFLSTSSLLSYFQFVLYIKLNDYTIIIAETQEVICKLFLNPRTFFYVIGTFPLDFKSANFYNFFR